MVAKEPIGTFAFGKAEYAVGLFWQAAPSAGAAEKAAKDLAADPQMDADVMVVRRAETIQFGLGKTRFGHKPGMVAVAAALADARSGTWAGVFAVEGGFVFCSVRKNAIVPDGDAWYSDENEARLRLEQDLTYPNYEAIYAPATWGIADSEEADIEDFLEDVKGARLKPVKSNPMPALLFMGVAAVAAVGGYWFLTLPPPQPQSVELPPPPPQPPPWVDTAPPGEMVVACMEAIRAVPSLLAGWRLTGASCADEQVVATYRRESGALIDLDSPAVLQQLGPGGRAAMRLDPNDANIVHLTAPIVVGKAERREERPHQAQDLSWHVVAMTQHYNLPVPKMEQKGDPNLALTLPTAGAAAETEVVEFELPSPLAPDVVFPVLDGISTLVIDRIQLATGSSTPWTISGRIYVVQ